VGVHHAESLAITINTGTAAVVWTDGIFSRENYTTRTPSGLTSSLEESSRLQKCLEESDATVLPAFDAALTDELPNGVVAG